MLERLEVRNYALIEQLSVEFDTGLNILSGETGAGKSILIGALGLLLGERADKALVRAGEDACGAEAAFHLAEPSGVDAVLTKYGLEPCADGHLVIRRIIRLSGASQTIVNDSPVTLQVLKEIGERLVDMHGPHDHQSLLDTEAQLAMLDAFGHIGDDLSAYASAYAALQDLDRRRAALAGGQETLAEQMDLLRYRVKEIEESKIQEGEEEEIRKEHAVLGNAQRIQELTGGILAALNEGESSAFDVLAGARRSMEELKRLLPQGDAWCSEAEAAARRIQELATDIAGVVEGIESSPVRLEWLEGRLATCQRMRKKYGPEVSDVLATLAQSRQRLHDLETRGEQLAALDQEMTTVRSQMQALGLALRKKRKAAGKQLAAAVKKELNDLGLPHGDFAVALAECEPRASGMDAVEFEFAPNIGEPKRPLHIIASSGEISRVMLAIKTVLAGHDRIPVLVFDEIDTNVGGEMGSAVGRKLAEVARSRQVLCITHLPQVAIAGQAHYGVAKSVRDGRTFSEVRRLQDEERVEEIARMLGGRDLTTVTLTHAREMLAKA